MYSSLHNHSEYSLLDGFGHPKEYLERAKEVGLKAFAITEHGNAYSWCYFDELQSQYPDLKLIYGVELYECWNHLEKDKESKYFHLLVLAKNEQGRIALNEIITKSNFEGFYYKPRVDLEMLKPYAKDLVVCSACLASKIAREEDFDKCVGYVREYAAIFPNFYLEMQSHDTADQSAYNKKILKLSRQTGIPFVITTDSHAARKEDLEFQAYHVRIARDKETSAEIYSGCYIQSDKEIHDIMDSQIGKVNVQLGLDNSNAIADLIDEVHMPWSDPKLPTFPLPEKYSSNYEMLCDLCKQGWHTRGIDKKSEQEQEVYKKRLDYELGVIKTMGFPGYFLIVWDFVQYAKKHHIIVGDGRGSGGGAMVVYLLGITELDPIEYNLIFERFLNPERVSFPDIDEDFADRASIISYLMNKYGEDHVCQILNVSYITPNVSIKDVGRVLGVPYSTTEKIASKFTFSSFQECMDTNKDLLIKFHDQAELFRIASKISGRVRNVSMHAGGVCVFDDNVTDYMPMKLGSDNEHVIQVDKKIVERIGGVKFDILGVRTLKVVQDAASMAGLSPEDLSINNPVFANDKDMYKLLCSAKTNGVFQVESQGMKDLFARLQPSSLGDVSAALALYRPDSMPMLEEFIENKITGKVPVYIHPDMAEILDDTYGCMIYQEQMMDIVRKFGGRSYGGADKFRKGIGKKDKELIKAESEKLYGEIKNNGYSEGIAKTISDTLAQKGGYLFNKSHSALYSILTLKTAYLKAHYPTEFFCALLNQNLTDFGTINKYILDAKDFGVEILPPHINRSTEGFSVYNGKILFGLTAIKGIGDNVVQAILSERTANGKFTGLEDFIARTAKIHLTTAQMVSLIKSGAIPTKDKSKILWKYFDWTVPVPKPFKPTKTLPSKAKLLLDYGIDSNVITGKEEKLSLVNATKFKEYNEKLEKTEQKQRDSFAQKYATDPKFWEFETLSVFLSDNPFEGILPYISVSFEQAEEGSQCTIVGVVSGVIKKKDKNKNTFAFINMNSLDGFIELTCWAGQYKKYSDLLTRGQQLAVLVKKNQDKAIIQDVKPYRQWLADRKIDTKRSKKEGG